MGFIDFVKQGLGITSAQKALQTVGQYAPRPATDTLIASENVMRAPPMVQIPRFEMPKYLPSTVQWFGNTVSNLPAGIIEQGLNTPGLFMKGVANTGLDLAGQLNHGERIPITQYASDLAPFAEGLLNVATSGLGAGVAKAGLKAATAPVVKKTMGSMLKSGAKSALKMSVEGGLIGGGYGLTQGLQQDNGSDVGVMLDNAIKGTLRGAGEGAIAGPVIGGVIHGASKAFGKGKQLYDSMSPKERQAGFAQIKPEINSKNYEIYKEGSKFAVDTKSVSKQQYVKERLTGIGAQRAGNKKLLESFYNDQQRIQSEPKASTGAEIGIKPKGNLDIPSMDKFLDRAKTTLEPKVYPQEKVGTPYTPTGKVKLGLRETQLADTIVKEMSLQSPRTFNAEKANTYVENVIKSIGVNKVEHIRTETLKFNKEKGITKFHELVQAEIQGNEALASNAKGRSVSTILKKPVEAIAEPPIQARPVEKPVIEPVRNEKAMAKMLAKDKPVEPKVEAKPWEEAGYTLPKNKVPDTIPITEKTTLKDTLPKPETVKSNAERGSHLKNAESYVNKKLQDVTDFINKNNINPDDVTAVWDKGENPSSPMVTKAIEMLRKVNDEIYTVRTSHGEKVNYNTKMPRSYDNIQLDNIFGDESGAFDTVIADTHRLNRTGKGEGYITDPVEAVRNSAKYAIQDYLKPVSEVQKTIADHIQKSVDENTPATEANKPLDYVTLLTPDKNEQKPVIDTKISLTFGRDPIETQNHVFNRVPELSDAYKMLRDAQDLAPVTKVKLTDLAAKGDADGLAKLIVEMTGKPESSIPKLKADMAKYGIVKYAQAISRKLSGDWQLQNFADVARKYEYSDPLMRDFVNRTIDNGLKQEKIKKTVVDKVLDGVSKMFSNAQILGNIKVALQQPLESTRIAASTLSEKGNRLGGVKALLQAVPKSIIEKKRLALEYGFGNKDFAMFQDNKGKGILSKIESVGYAPMQAFENWKNSIYASAGETIGKQKGLSGQKLTTFVRDFVYNYSALQDKASSSVVLKNNSLARLVFQYSQYKIKTAQTQYDAAKAGKYAEFVGLFASDVFNAAAVTAAFGLPMNYALQNILMPFGIGPFGNFISQVGSTAWDAGKSIMEGEDVTDQTKRAALKTTFQNIIPAGSQLWKTGNAANEILTGEAKSPSGRLKYLTDEDPTYNKAQALLFGPSVLKSNKDFYRNQGGIALGDTQTKLVDSSMDKKQTVSEILAKRKENKLDTIEKNKLKSSGDTISQANNKVYIKRDNGDVSVIDPSWQPKAPTYTGQSEVDKKLKSKYSSELNSKEKDIIDLYKAGIYTAQEAEKKIQESNAIQNTLKAPKKAKKITARKIKVPRIKALKIKTPKYKSVKLKIAKSKTRKSLKAMLTKVPNYKTA